MIYRWSWCFNVQRIYITRYCESVCKAAITTCFTLYIYIYNVCVFVHVCVYTYMYVCMYIVNYTYFINRCKFNCTQKLGHFSYMKPCVSYWKNIAVPLRFIGLTLRTVSLMQVLMTWRCANWAWTRQVWLENEVPRFLSMILKMRGKTMAALSIWLGSNNRCHRSTYKRNLALRNSIRMETWWQRCQDKELWGRRFSCWRWNTGNNAMHIIDLKKK